MTDAFTDELFYVPLAKRIVFPISRLIVDVERFKEDSMEPMTKVGMGVIYTKTSDGNKMRRQLSEIERKHLIKQYYRPHHKMLEEMVMEELQTSSYSLIIDCHSFPSAPLPCEREQSQARPDFCIGTDEYHTPDALLEEAEAALCEHKHRVKINRPYSGTLVPLEFYHKEPRVMSIMVEVNRSLYLDESTGSRTVGFERVRSQLSRMLEALIKEVPTIGSTLPLTWRRDHGR